MYCGEHSLVNHRGPEHRVASLRCRRWTCDDCASINRAKLRYLAREGHPTTFITLTAIRAPGLAADLVAQLMSRAVSQLVQRIRRRPGCADFAMLLTFEATKAGWPHVHIIARAPFIPWQWLRAAWADLTGATVTDIRFIPDAGRGVAYVTKYVGKAPHRFAHCRRWRRSRNWTRRPDDDAAPRDDLADRWERWAKTQAEVVAEWIARGFEVRQQRRLWIAVERAPP